MKRAYSLLTVKSVDEEGRILEGMATTPEPDRMGDIVEPLGVKFKNPMPLLWQHQHDKPVGTVKFGKATADGIPFTATLAKIAEPGALKDRIDEAWQSVKAKLVRGVSIGFRALEYAFIEGTGGIRFTETEVLELSLVTIPANSDCTIQTIKSLDKSLLAASGQERGGVVRLGTPPGVTGKSSKPTTPKEMHMKTVKEQIADFEAKRAANAARLSAIMQKASDEGRTLDEAEGEEHDTLEGEVESIDKHLVRLRKLEASELAAAKAAEGGNSRTATVARSTGPAIIINREPEEKFKGQKYTRLVIAKALAFLEQSNPIAIARRRGWDKQDPTLFRLIQKANEIASGGTDSGEWGAELAEADTRYTGDFIEFLYSMTVFDRLPLRQVPANVHIKGQDGAATGYWVGQSKAIGVSKPDFSDVELTFLKVAALAVVSNELLRESSPAAEQLVRDALVQASAQRVDTTFVSAAAASSGVSPAGILNGVSAIPATGWDADALRADIKSLYAEFISAKNATGLQFVMNPALAKSISLMRNALGQREFPELNAGGGSLEGDPVTTGDNVNPLHLILLKPSDIYRIGDTGVQVSVSRDATIEMSSAPIAAADVPTGQTQNPVSMFQTESTAIKVVRSINFAKRRTHAAQFVADAEYGTESAST